MQTSGGGDERSTGPGDVEDWEDWPPPGLALLDAADLDAWHARKRYPSTLSAGGPVFGVARELGDGRWAVHADLTALAAQDSRDALAADLRASADADKAAADRLESGAADEAAPGGARHRVIRADRFIRMGPDGPEPPRASDADRPLAAQLLDVGRPADALGTVLHAELAAALRSVAAASPRVGQDARRAARSHPRAVLLPAAYMTVEREPGGRWLPHSTGTSASPREARDHLAVHLRLAEPFSRDLSAAQRALYGSAADRLLAEQCDQLDVEDRHFRVIRVERLVRMGPDGPEPPRASDPVPPAPVPLTDADLDRFRTLVSGLPGGS